MKKHWTQEGHRDGTKGHGHFGGGVGSNSLHQYHKVKTPLQPYALKLKNLKPKVKN